MSDRKINEQAEAAIARIKQPTERMLAAAGAAGAEFLTELGTLYFNVLRPTLSDRSVSEP